MFVTHGGASYTVGSGSLPVVKWRRRGVDHPSSTEVKETVVLYLYPHFWAFMACSRVNFPFTFTFTFPFMCKTEILCTSHS